MLDSTRVHVLVTVLPKVGTLAQSVEQWTENPRVPSSILGGANLW